MDAMPSLAKKFFSKAVFFFLCLFLAGCAVRIVEIPYQHYRGRHYRGYYQPDYYSCGYCSPYAPYGYPLPYEPWERWYRCRYDLGVRGWGYWGDDWW
jgi:hypothetical protein